MENLNTNQQAAQIELWRMPQVEAATGLKSSQIYNLISDGRFPRQVKLGPRASAFVSREILTWIHERIEERDNARGAA